MREQIKSKLLCTFTMKYGIIITNNKIKEDEKVYVHPFIVGAVTVVLIEVLILIVAVAMSDKKM